MSGDKDSDTLRLFGSLTKASGRHYSAADAVSEKDNKDATGKKAKPCRVCDSFKSWRIHEAKSHSKRDQEGSGAGATAAIAAATTAAQLGSSAASLSTLAEDACPPDSQVLGRATWTFLHTMAAYYPEKANQKQQSMMTSLLSSFSHFYPCGRCASHLRQEMARSPPAVDTRQNLSLWLCQTHNKVNVMLGKDEFDCAKVDERWRDGPSDGRCSWAQDIEY
ncbi:Flavin-linked sulfhydryl oxidase of the mitochondrial IMS [Coemansia sp. RSA 2050]|nr:Flavin-linked sulfhydryl oxidase of the mitochondrial IMS [Coemansia sp. RSA 2050]KAJ2731680.1 Flavin-linked sulfhydryl oxidase of the mitochondrial IMS [Coemansia sp. BCRC 34962]